MVFLSWLVDVAEGNDTHVPWASWRSGEDRCRGL